MKATLPILLACVSMAGLAQTQAPAPVEPKPVIVNGPITVTTEDFEAFLLRAPAERRPDIRTSLDRVNQALESVYTNRVLAEEARKAGLDRDPRLQLRMKQVVEGLLATAWTEHYGKSLPPTDYEVRAREMYLLNKAKFTDPERVDARHIVISLRNRTRADALALANAAVAKASSGASFEAIVGEYTDDPNGRATGGSIKGVAAADLEKPVADALFALKPGEIAGPVESRDALHVVKLESRQPARTKSFEEVRENLVALERENYINLSTDRRIGELKNTPQTRIYRENIQGLVVDIDREAIKRKLAEPMPGEKK